MVFESIKRLGLDFAKNIDYDNSDEIYDPSTNNHIIELRLKKIRKLILQLILQLLTQ